MKRAFASALGIASLAVSACDLATPEMTEQASLYSQTQTALNLYGPIESGDISSDMALLLRRMNRATLIDVRTPGERRASRIAEGAAGITLQDHDFLDQVLNTVGGDKTRPVALICQSGNRSLVAQRQLQAAGFETVYNVTGGTLDWRAQGLPLEDCLSC